MGDVEDGCFGAGADVFLGAVSDEGDARGGADVYACVALYTFVFGEDGLHVTVEATLGLAEGDRPGQRICIYRVILSRAKVRCIPFSHPGIAAQRHTLR